jgi:hypothetical protein
MTEQIYYNMWGSESEEHKDYFQTIGTIADWIGYALIGPRHRPYTTEIMPLSNISVLQTKEKFGSPRVYVSFSEETFLEDARHYRSVYKQAIKLFPQYEKAIKEGMDYSTYLYDTEEEIQAYIDDRKKWLNEGKAKQYFDIEYYAQKLERLEEEKDFLKKVCLFT